MCEATGIFGPFSDQRRTMAVIIKANFIGFMGVVKPVKISVNQRDAK